MIELIAWLGQNITVPLWGFIVALLLPAAFFAKIAKEAIMAKLNGTTKAE